MSRHGLHFSVSGCRLPVRGSREGAFGTPSPTVTRAIAIFQSKTATDHPKPPRLQERAKTASRLHELAFLWIESSLRTKLVTYFESVRCLERSFCRFKELAEAAFRGRGPGLLRNKTPVQTKRRCALKSVRCLERLFPPSAYAHFPAQRRPDGPHETVVIELA